MMGRKTKFKGNQGDNFHLGKEEEKPVLTDRGTKQEKPHRLNLQAVLGREPSGVLIFEQKKGVALVPQEVDLSGSWGEYQGENKGLHFATGPKIRKFSPTTEVVWGR